MGYIVDDEQQREVEAIERVLLDPVSKVEPYTWPTLRWRMPWGRYATRIPTALLLPSGVDEASLGLPGDIDLIGGPISPIQEILEREHEKLRRERPAFHPTWWTMLALATCIEKGAVIWPPSFDTVAAAEVKSSALYADLRATARMKKKLERARRQAEGLTKMGFDRVALIVVPGTEPVDGMENPWLEALNRAAYAGRRIEMYLEEQRVKAAGSQPYGEILLSIGAVPGGNETMRGSVAPKIISPAPDLPRAAGSREALIRSSVNSFFEGVFAQVSKPRSLPVVFRYCPRCKKVFWTNGALAFGPDPKASRACPHCGKAA